MEFLESYLREARKGLYGLILAAPLFLIYELSVIIADLRVRNGADAIISRSLSRLPFLDPNYFKIIIIIIIFGVLFLRTDDRRLRMAFIPLIFAESIIYSIFLGTVVNKILEPLVNFPFLFSRSQLPANAITAVGAGLYEEFLFRFLLFGFLFWAGKKIFSDKVIPGILAGIVASILFSAYHYLGSLAPPFELYSFLYRMVGGMVLTAIYYYRGFAIAAYTHAFYDLWIIGIF